MAQESNNEVTQQEKDVMFKDMANLADGITKSQSLYKDLLSFFEQHIECMKSIQNNTDALELAAIAHGYINNLKASLKDNAKSVLSQVSKDAIQKAKHEPKVSGHSIKLQHIISLTDNVITLLDSEDKEVRIDRNQFEEWFGVDKDGYYEAFDDKQETITCEIVGFYANPVMFHFNDFVAKYPENYTISC